MPCGLRHKSPPPYEYRSLDTSSHEIRLLRPRSQKYHLCPPGRTLSFSLETVKVAHPGPVPPYYAISYAWGETSWSSQIYIGGNPLAIPRGAEAALRGVLNGMRTAKLEALPIWIDAVCIKQHDDTREKSHQVGIMGDIFARAKCVLIWLGPDNGRFKKSIRMCQTLADECQLYANGATGLELNRSLHPRERQALPYMKVPPPPGRQLAAFYEILQYSWFNRLWVIQEVVLSKRAILFCGKSQIPWESFTLAVHWVRHRIPLWMAECVTSEDFEALAKINKISYLKPGHENMTMEALLAEAFRFQASNPLDKVYGLLGMVGHCPDISPIVPDYRKSMVEVYAEATWFAIKQELSLGLLCGIAPPSAEELEQDHSLQDDKWPSWVPRYDLNIRRSIVAVFSTDSNAHNDFEAIVNFTPNPPFVLEVHGVSLGTIAKCRHVPQNVIESNMYEDHDELFRFFSYLWDPDFLESKGLAWNANMIKTLAAALVCGNYGRLEGNNPYQDGETDPVTAIDFAAFMMAIKDECDLPDNPQLQSLLDGFDEEADVALYAKEVKHFAQKFVHLEFDGGRFGVGDKACEEGDEICILFGAKHPLVMRKVGDQYRLLGTVYVAGVMKGQYVQSLEDAGTLESTDRIYEIC